MNDWVKIGLGVLGGIAAYGAYDYCSRDGRMIDEFMAELEDEEEVDETNDDDEDETPEHL